MTSALTTRPTGTCRGCQAEKRLRADDTVPPHPLPIDMRVDGYESCPGGDMPPEALNTVVELEPVVAEATAPSPAQMPASSSPSAVVALVEHLTRHALEHGPAEVAPTTKVVVRRGVANLAECRVCGRRAELRADGRIGSHRDGLAMWCDGKGRMPRSTS